MVEELKLAIKIDDASIEQSLLKQFANAQKMADKVVLDFRNVNFDDKQIEAKFKEMQKKAGQNPIDLTISDNALDMLGQIDKRLTEIFSIGKGKSFIDSSSITADIRKIENKINELNKKINTSFDTKNKTEAYNQLKKYADAFKDYYNNEEAMASESGTKAAYAYYKAYEEALKKEVAQSKLEKVTVDFDINDKFLDKNRIVSDRIKEYANYKKYGNDNDLLEEISSLKNKLFDFNSAYSQVKEKLGQAAITPEIIKSVERYVELLDKARFLEQLNDPDDNDTIKSHRAMAQVSLDDALFNAQEQSNKYTESLRQQEEQITSTVEAEQKLAEVQKETTSNSVTSDNSQIEELKSDIQEVKTELGDVKDRISSIESNGFENVREDVEKTKESVKELNGELTEMKSNISSTPQESNISSGMKDAIPSTEATASVEKTTQAIREENNALDETVSKAKQAASELTKTRDIVSQNWYREKGTVVGKDSKGNDITRDADEFSFVERLKNGQLQTVLATYDEETGKWAEQVINVRTAFEQVEKAIISADNKIASLEIAKERTLASHPGYDATADDNQIAIERKKRDELQATLNLYGSEKEYVFEIEAATKRIADNQKRLNNKKQSQTNLRQAVSDEKDAKANEQANKRDAKQAQIEAENIKLAEQKSIYNELIDSIDRYSTVSKRIESGKAFEGDYEEAARLQEKIEELQNNPILSQEQLDASQRKLEKIETTLEDIATAKEKSDSIKVDSENVKNIQAEWDKNIKAIQDYMDAMTKLNNLKAKDKGTGSEANQIALQTQNVEELKQAALDARKNLSSIQAENPDIIAWKQWVDMMKLFDQASKGSAESAAKLKDVLDNIKAPSLDKYENKLASYQTKKGAYNATIARFNDGGWTSDEYLKNVQAVKDAVNEYETLLNELKGKDASLVTSDDISKLDEYEKKIKDAIATVTNMSAAEKGYNFVSGQKELDKIHKLLNENSKMSSEAKAKIKAYYAEIESGNPSMSLDRIHGEIMKIYNAEVEAGRAGRSFFDTLKNSGFHKLAAQMSGMFGFYDVINIGKQAISTIVSLDDALLDLKKTTSMSSTELNNFYYSANDVAKQMGVTTKSIIEQASAWSRLGYSSNEQATEMAKLSSKFASISPGMDTDQAQEGMVSIMKAWQINPEDVEKEILDPINQLGNKFAESNNDIVEGMKRSAAALAAVGTDYKDAYSLFTGVQEVLQNSEVAGRALRSISMRIRGYDENSEDGFEQTDDELKNITGDLIDLTKTAQHTQGVSIFKEGSTTEFKRLVDYFGEIHDIWDEMSQKQQNDFLQKAFGKTQAQAGAALIQNYDAVKEALAEIDESAGSADKEMSTVEQTLSYKINALKETWVGCAQQILDRGDLGIAISGLNSVSKVITGLIDNVGLLKTAAMGVAAALSFKNVGIDTLVAY